MTAENFQQLLTPVFETIEGQTVNRNLGALLNRICPPDGKLVREIEAACHAGIKAGWMCAQGDAGRKFGRVIEPSPQTNDLSIDVVDLDSAAGPRHVHPTGEICLVLPQNADARFCGKGAGWCAFKAGSAHVPAVTNGRALVLYLLPQGKIEFTKS